jgi:hypothetical protein
MAIEVEKKWKDPRISVMYFVCPADDAKTAPLYNASPMNSPSHKFVNVRVYAKVIVRK